MNCTATHGALTCRRLDTGNERWRLPHPMPHIAHDGTQWDQHGVCVVAGRNAYRSAT